MTASLLLVCAGCSDGNTVTGDDTGVDASSIVDTGVTTDGSRVDGGACPDSDGDGARDAACGGTDCDDADPNRAPGRAEICDAAHVDEDCDPTTIGVRDNDGDGYVDANCCNGTHCGDDCNDMRSVEHPTATEACDGFDNDCDTAVDEGVLETFYPDTDHDGFGDAMGATMQACTAPPHYTTLAMATDCNDMIGSINPSAMEICDAAGVDENCDGAANPMSLCMCRAGDPPRMCALPGLCAMGNESCNNGSWGMCSVMPVGETCNHVDDDCDNQIDEGLTVDCYADTDNDTYPNPSAPMQRLCPDPARTSVGTCPTGTTNRVPDPTTNDCAPSDSTVHPLASEVCNMVDDNCNAMTDEGVATTCYLDMDGDHYAPSTATASQQCNDPTRAAYGYCPVNYTNMAPGSGVDCNDSAFGTNPGATEVCDGPMADEDCDGMHNEGCSCSGGGTPVACSTMGMGRCGVGTTMCVGGMWMPPCPTPITETCNMMDDDCNGVVDNGVDFPCCPDVDGDTWVASLTPTTRACTCPSGTRTCPALGTSLDCNDTSPSVHPMANEVCNNIDDNCVGGIDEGVRTTYYQDGDNDGFGNPAASMMACTVPAGYVSDATDCNDASNVSHPSATEICDGLDNDCSTGGGAVSAEDRDGDHYTLSTYSQCSGGPYPRGDCYDSSTDPSSGSVHPGATYMTTPAFCPATATLRLTTYCATLNCCILSTDTCSAAAGCATTPNWDWNCINGEEPGPRYPGTCNTTGSCAGVSGYAYTAGSPPACGAPSTYHDCCAGNATSTRPFSCR